MLSPLPRRSGWVVDFARYPSHVSLPRKGCRVGLRIVLFEACSAFTRVTACTLALPPIRGTHSEGFSYFVTSIAAPVASGWSGCRVGLAPTYMRPRVSRRFFANNISSLRKFQGELARAQFCIDGTPAPLLGRAERSIPRARRVAPEGARG